MRPPLRPLRPLLFALLAALPPGGRGEGLDLRLPDMGDSAGAVISPVEERRLGEEFMRQIRQELKLVEDPEIGAYLDALGHRLAGHSDAPGQHFTFFLLDDPAINAFALPGGFIGVNSGLIEASHSESELAAVLAHEIAHVTQRHIARTVEEQGKLGLAATASVVAAILLAATVKGQAANAALAATQAGLVQSQINFTRGNEYEADRVGMQILTRSGFDPSGMPDFFERLSQATRFYAGSPEFLRTHPVTGNRIAEARGRIKEGVRHEDNPRYQLARARLKVLTGDTPEAVAEEFRRQLEQGLHDDRDAARYGLAVALTRAGKAKDALGTLRELIGAEPDNPAYIDALAQAELAAGRRTEALERYRKALEIYPGDYPLSLNYGHALLAAGRGAEAHPLLLGLARDRSDPALMKLLAQAAEATGRHGEAQRHMAEYHHQSGDTGTALLLLERAVAAADSDFYERSKAQARLEELRQVQAAARKPGKSGDR